MIGSYGDDISHLQSIAYGAITLNNIRLLEVVLSVLTPDEVKENPDAFGPPAMATVIGRVESNSALRPVLDTFLDFYSPEELDQTEFFPEDNFLSYAVKRGSMFSVKKLLERGANVNAIPESEVAGKSVLHHWIDSNVEAPEMGRLLLKAGADMAMGRASDRMTVSERLLFEHNPSTLWALKILLDSEEEVEDFWEIIHKVCDYTASAPVYTSPNSAFWAVGRL